MALGRMVQMTATMDVLLVEDDPRIARVVERALTDVGHRVEVAHDGLEGLTSAERGKHVIDQALAALGGDRFLNMQDRVESGRAYSFYREQLSGLSFAKIYTRYLVRPEPPTVAFLGIREREAFGKKEDSAVLLTEKEGFNVSLDETEAGNYLEVEGPSDGEITKLGEKLGYSEKDFVRRTYAELIGDRRGAGDNSGKGP